MTGVVHQNAVLGEGERVAGWGAGSGRPSSPVEHGGEQTGSGSKGSARRAEPRAGGKAHVEAAERDAYSPRDQLGRKSFAHHRRDPFSSSSCFRVLLRIVRAIRSKSSCALRTKPSVIARRSASVDAVEVEAALVDLGLDRGQLRLSILRTVAQAAVRLAR